MKTAIIILLTVAAIAGGGLLVKRMMQAPDGHLAVPADTQPIHKLPEVKP